MSAKQSKIFNFFQRKPSLPSNSSPLPTKINHLDEKEKSFERTEIGPSGDVALKIEKEISLSKCGNMSLQTKRRKGEDTLDTSFQDDLLDPYLVDKVCGQAETSIQQDDRDEVQESRPPKKKRKRIVSSSYKSIIPGKFPNIV